MKLMVKVRGPGLVPALFPAPLARSALEPATTPGMTTWRIHFTTCFAE